MKNITKFYIVVITISYIILNIAYFIMYQKSEDMISKMYPYNNILIGEEVRNDINDVCEYIKENEKQNINVEIISHRAFLYMNILNKSNKYFDFPLLGNLGKDGENNLISKVDTLKSGTKILISKEKFWQESEKLLNKIKNEYKYIGEIGNLYIYEK